MRIVSALELPEDIADRVYEMEKTCFSDPWSALSFRKEREAERLYLAMEDDTLLGYIVYWRIIDECEIANIAVDPDRRGEGIGGALLGHALACGADKFFLEVRESNEAAKALYFKYGFTPYGKRKNYYRDPTEDAILLSKC